MIFNNSTRIGNNQNYSPQTNNDINIEISYDNFDSIEKLKKQQYSIDLRNQIMDNKRRRDAEREKKRLEDLAEEERLRREREELEARKREENRRYRPIIDLPIQKIKEVEPLKKVKRKTPKVNHSVEETNNNLIQSLNENTLKYLKMRELQMDDYNEKILRQLQLLNRDFRDNMHTIKSELDILNDMNNRHKKFKNKFYEDVHFIKLNLDNKKIDDIQDTKGIYELINETDYMKQKLGNMRYYGEEPHKKYKIKTYITNEPVDDNRFIIDDEKKSDGLKLSPYINLSHVITHETPKWTPGIYDTLFVE
jgi:hypothetical protein